MMKENPSYQDLQDQIFALRKENELLRSKNPVQGEQFYSALIDNMSEGFAHCQMLYENNIPADFIYLEVNKAFEKLTGIENVTGKRVSEILANHKQENPELFDLYDRVTKTGIPEKAETYIEPLKTWFSISVYSSEKGKFLVIFDDITERKSSEEALRISEEQFRGLFIQSNVGTAIVGLDKCFISCNQAFCKFLGYPEEEIIGKQIRSFTHPDDLSIGMEDMKQVANGEVKFAVLQKRYIKKDGSVVWGELTISLVRGEDGKPLYFLPVIQDITERYLAIKSLEEREIDLKKLNDTKDKLFSIIAHDLRSPFNGFIGFYELFTKSIEQADYARIRKYADVLFSSAKNTLSLLENLLNWAKSQTGQIDFDPQLIDLSSIINEVIKYSYLSAFSKNISLIHEHSDDFEVFADENILKIILQNLISNAIKFTKPGGKVTLLANKNKKFAEISVSDNGLGMTKDKMNKLFDLSTNYSTPGTQNEKGSGLGLIICKEFVEKHGGRIWVESEEHRGSDFKFTLPLSTQH